MSSTNGETPAIARKKDRKLSAMDRVILQAMGEDRHVGKEDDPAKQQWPQLWEWLSTIYVGRDKIKQPAVLTITLGPEGVLCRLTDRDLAVSVNVSTAHLADVFPAIEAVLNAPDIPVQSWGKREPKLRTRSQKS